MRIRTHIRNNVVGYVALFMALSGTAWAAGQIGSADIADNAVLSRHIRDGQVRNADLGLKAVTRPKLGLAAVGASQLGTGSVTGPKLAANSVTGAKVADGSLTGADVQNNSLTGADVDESKLYVQTQVVSPVGTPPQNGQALRDTLDSITDASAAKEYLVKIEPGEYDVGGTPLFMKDFVDLEGSGPDITKLDSSVAGGQTMTVNAAGQPVVSDLHVVGGAGGTAIAVGSNATLQNDVVAVGGSGPTVRSVLLGGGHLIVQGSTVATFASGTGSTGYGIDMANTATGLSIDDSEISASAVGAGSFASALSVNGPTADVHASSLIGFGSSGAGGFAIIDNGNNSTVTIDASQISGTQKAAGANTGNKILIGASKVVGGHDAGAPGTVTCVFSYKDTYVATNATCD
jgi:hypothetical protein